MNYTVEVPAFAGPLDLLLHLIERDELDITAISLVTVTEQYLAQVKQLQGHRMENLIDFLVIGSRLVLIKSRALLPQSPVIGLEELEEEEDSAEALARQLRQYKQFKQAAHWLQTRHTNALRTYLRVAPPLTRHIKRQLDLKNVDTQTLKTLFFNALQRMQMSTNSVAIVNRPRITIEGQIRHLRHTVKHKGYVQFHEILSKHTTRVELAITLLAVLELIKRREIVAEQTQLFAPIVIRSVVPPKKNTI